MTVTLLHKTVPSTHALLLCVFAHTCMPIFLAHLNLVPSSRTCSKANNSTRPFQTPQSNTALFLLSILMALKLRHAGWLVLFLFFFPTRFAIIQLFIDKLINFAEFNLQQSCLSFANLFFPSFYSIFTNF